MNRWTGIVLVICSGMGWLDTGSPAYGQETVPRIMQVQVELTDALPPVLIVSVEGEVTSGGHREPQLERLKYDRPPDDGVQEYRLTTRPPDGAATAVMSGVSARHRWDRVLAEGRWVRGIRVLGLDNGVLEIPLDQAAVDRIASIREFTGYSESGSLDEALQDARSRIDSAMNESGVANGMVTWQLGPVTGRMGGFAGFRDLTIKLYATRQPPWP